MERWVKEQRTKNKEQKTKNKEQKTKNKKQKTKNKKQRKVGWECSSRYIRPDYFHG